jgi:uncharacterized protein YlaI
MATHKEILLFTAENYTEVFGREMSTKEVDFIIEAYLLKVAQFGHSDIVEEQAKDLTKDVVKSKRTINKRVGSFIVRKVASRTADKTVLPLKYYTLRFHPSKAFKKEGFGM